MKNNIFSKLSLHIATALLLIIIPIQAWAASGTTTKTINLKDAIDTAISTNTSIKLLDDKIKLADKRYQTSLSDAKDAPTKHWSTDTQRIELVKEETLYPLQKESDVNELKWEKDNTAKQLQLEITKLYHQILLKQKA